MTEYYPIMSRDEIIDHARNLPAGTTARNRAMLRALESRRSIIKMALMVRHSKNYNPEQSFKQRLSLIVNACPKVNAVFYPYGDPSA